MDTALLLVVLDGDHVYHKSGKYAKFRSFEFEFYERNDTIVASSI